MTGARRPAPDERPVALTIAGSDSGGGAGIQADLKTMEATGAFGTSAITSLTAQHTRGVESTHPVPVAEVDAQVEAVLSDFDVRAVKTGMLGVEPVVETVTGYAADLAVPFVVDPVMVAASGDRLLAPEAEAAYDGLVAEATLVTPNADEAEVLTGLSIEDAGDMREAGERLVATGADAALVKGGHVGTDGAVVRDVLVTGEGVGSGDGGSVDADGGSTAADADDVAVHTFEHRRVDTDATHGSGCTLSSAIAARLARGDGLVDAVAAGTDLLARAVRYPLDVGQGPGAVHHLVALRERAARQPTQEAVEGVLDRLVAADARPLVPEVGTNVVGATPYAESPAETVAVEGRLARTASGVRSVRGTRYGASSHVARFLLGAREHDPSLRFAANVRFDDEVEAALGALDGPVVEVDRANEPAPDAEGSTMDWTADRAFERVASGTGDRDGPVAVFDRGAVGKEPMVRLLATDADGLAARAEGLLDAL